MSQSKQDELNNAETYDSSQKYSIAQDNNYNYFVNSSITRKPK